MTPQEKYEQELAEFIAMMEAKKPMRSAFKSEIAYQGAINEWSMALSCDRPNKPGSEFSNND